MARTRSMITYFSSRISKMTMRLSDPWNTSSRHLNVVHVLESPTVKILRSVDIERSGKWHFPTEVTHVVRQHLNGLLRISEN